MWWWTYEFVTFNSVRDFCVTKTYSVVVTGDHTQTRLSWAIRPMTSCESDYKNVLDLYINSAVMKYGKLNVIAQSLI